MAKSPTVGEFKAAVGDAFGYLEREFACRPAEPPAQLLEGNPFLAWYANATTLIQVEGINYGFATQVILGPADAGGDYAATLPLWTIVKHRRPDLYDAAFGSRGQIDDIRVYAHALRDVAGDVLRGDFTVFAAARAILDAQLLRLRAAQQEDTRRYRHEEAVSRAADAFRAHDFDRVVELLLPLEALLTRAERAKLDYAGARIAGAGSKEMHGLGNLVPRDKADLTRARAAVAAGYPAVAPVLAELFEWLRDGNWPVARILAPFLGRIGLPVVEQVRHVLSSNDDLWKYWVLKDVVAPQPAVVAAIAGELERIVQSPSSGERAEGVLEIAEELVQRDRSGMRGD